MAFLQIDKLLETVVREKVSDLHITTGQPPVVRASGHMVRLETKSLEPEDTVALMKSITPERNQQELQEQGGTDFGFAFGDKARFRVAVFKQRGHIGMVLRRIPNEFLSFEQLGLPPIIKDLIRRPRGLFLVTGPTGSGKTTSLASMINYLNDNDDMHIITLEDPIEYGLSGISQIPINTTGGQQFADGLRSVLRLDPDVVMVGEIRDQDTARTAIQASITGHLVLSSFHANSTSTAFSRIIDMIGVNPIFSSAIRLVIAQRLVRRLVDETKQAYEPDEATRSYVKRVLEGIPEDTEHPDLDTFSLWRPVASDDAPFGYKGRIVIMEQLIVDEEIQRFIRGDVEDVHPEAIETAARKHGMLTLEQAGVLAALRGETTLDEIARVI